MHRSSWEAHHGHRPATRPVHPKEKPKTGFAEGEKIEGHSGGALRLENGLEQISRQPMRASAKSKGGSIAKVAFLPMVEVADTSVSPKRLKSLPVASAFALLCGFSFSQTESRLQAALLLGWQAAQSGFDGDDLAASWCVVGVGFPIDHGEAFGSYTGKAKLFGHLVSVASHDTSAGFELGDQSASIEREVSFHGWLPF